MDLNTQNLYPERTVDGELISWPYISISPAGADLDSLRAIEEGQGETLLNEDQEAHEASISERFQTHLRP